MDQLSPAERAEVVGYLVTYPALRQELNEIERSLEIYAMSASLPAPAGLKDRILHEIKDEIVPERTISGNEGKNKIGIWPAVAALFGLGILLFGYLFWQKNNDLNRLEQDFNALRDTCRESTQQLTEQLQILQQLTYPDNKILPFQATPGFASTDLYLHHNSVTRRNFIQVRNLPQLTANQSFQLWSLKPNQAPAPLDVFDPPANGLIEVRYVDGTETYAITIEPRGGKDTPTLEQLIGTVGVGGI